MTGYARPELLASTDWLADNLDRPEVRILDVRWRPDGTARNHFAAGHVPGAVHLDWADELAHQDAALGQAQCGVQSGETASDDADGLAERRGAAPAREAWKMHSTGPNRTRSPAVR